ncbi:MAG: hypothetical protein LKF66_11285, partial [Clostridium tyrobutyricum]|nr:hypothetical protein [Clostridium tyrobutyricum]
MAKGKATVNQFKTNSSIGFRMIIPKRIVDEFQIKDKEIFCQKLIDGHIEMERPINKNDENTILINQFKTNSSFATRIIILQDIVMNLNIENTDIMLF